jgi:hypothetical protein
LCGQKKIEETRVLLKDQAALQQESHVLREVSCMDMEGGDKV